VRRSGAARGGCVFSSDSDGSLSLPDEPDDSDVADPFWARPALRSASGSASPSPPPRDAFHASVPYDEARTRTPPPEPGAPTHPPLSTEEQAELADLEPEEVAVYLRAKQERQRQERIAGVERVEREQAEAQRAERERRAQEERDRWKVSLPRCDELDVLRCNAYLVHQRNAAELVVREAGFCDICEDGAPRVAVAASWMREVTLRRSNA
jgi:hypothetical protein